MFEKAEIEIIKMNVKDIITTSPTGPDCPTDMGSDCIIL